MTVLGITGTVTGCTPAQYARLREYIAFYGDEVHHGDCIGVDAQAHKLALDMNRIVVMHPPNDPKKRAFCEGAHVVHIPRTYMKRNDDIAQACDIVVGFTRERFELLRNGYWACMRHALKAGKQVLYVPPDGMVRRFQKSIY